MGLGTGSATVLATVLEMGSYAQNSSAITERILPSHALALAHPARPVPAMVPPFVFPPKFTRAHVRPPAHPLYRCPLARPEMELPGNN